jgi:hypothetical protein
LSTPPPSSQPESIQSAVVGNNKQRLIGPVAKAMLNLYDIDSSKIIGTGPHGSLMKR